MNRLVARLSLAITLTLCTLVSPIRPPAPAAASHLPPPGEIVIQPGDAPAGLEPFEEAGVASLLPDSLARQAAVSFQRDPARSSEPGVRYVRQVVLAFDERDAAEYLDRFQGLMVRHQGYSVEDRSESEFRLIRTQAEETSAVVGVAHGEVLVVTTVAGVAGTVGPDDAAALSLRAVARVPVVEQSAAALSSEPGTVTLANAMPGPGDLNIPNQQDAARFPQPVQQLPGPPEVGVVQARDRRPVRDASLDALMPVQPNQVRPADWPADLLQFTRTLEPILNEFWSRALYMTDVDYYPPRFIVIPAGQEVYTGCREYTGEPALADSLAYCPADETVYVYEPFLRDERVAGEDWRTRDYVIPTVAAHEWGHHIQKLTNLTLVSGVLIVNNPDNWPLITRQKELQADCYAGLFTRYARDRGWLNPGDLDEAREALIRAGDHHIDSPGHHGTPEQRREWFMRGFNHYAFSTCDPW